MPQKHFEHLNKIVSQNIKIVKKTKKNVEHINDKLRFFLPSYGSSPS